MLCRKIYKIEIEIESSLLFKVFKALENNPVKNDWISGARECLDKFDIHMSFQEIKLMKTTQYKNIVKKQANKAAFRYLLQKQEGGKKGKFIKYDSIQMADYLLPECSLSVSDKREMFAFRCEMNNLPDNFGKSEMCEQQCQTLMNNEHLLSCSHLNQGQSQQLEMNQIRNGNIVEKIEVLKKLQENSERRLKLIEA